MSIRTAARRIRDSPWLIPAVVAAGAALRLAGVRADGGTTLAALVSTAQIPLFYLAARRWVREPAARAIALLLALHPLAIDLASRSPRDNAWGLALAAALALFDAATPLRCAGAGVLLGGGAPVQVAAPLFAVLLSLQLWRRQRRGAAAALAGGALAGGVAAMLLMGAGDPGARLALVYCPVYRIHDGERALVHATADQRRTRPGEAPLPDEAGPAPLADSLVYAREGVGCIARAPTAALQRALINVADLFAGPPASLVRSWLDDLRARDRLADACNQVIAFVLAPLALLAAWRLRRREGVALLVGAPLLALCAGALVSPSEPMRRVPWDFALVLAVVAAVDAALSAPARSDSADGWYHTFTARYWVGELDLRPLALTRIVFGSVACLSTLEYGTALFDFFGRDGVLPVPSAIPTLIESLAARIDTHAAIAVVWAVGSAACAAFALGWHTRLANAAALAALVILQNRSQLPCDGSDLVIRVMLFWFLFTPAGTCCSLDARRTGARSHAPALTIRLAQVQFAWIYLASFLEKITMDHWRQGIGLHYALIVPAYNRWLGTLLANQRWFVVPGTYFTLVVEGSFLLLVFAPLAQPHLKRVALLGCGLMHVAIWVLMKPGFFSYVMLSLYLLYFEPAWIARWMPASERLTPSPSPLGAASSGRLGSFIGQGVLAVLLGLAIWQSAPLAPPIPPVLDRAVYELQVAQGWSMFKFERDRTDQRFEAIGWLADGTVVEPARGRGRGAIIGVGQTLFYSRWIKLEQVVLRSPLSVAEAFAGVLCRRWNEGGTPRLARVALIRRERPLPPMGGAAGSWENTRVLERDCLDASP